MGKQSFLIYGFRGVNDKLMDGSINVIVADCKANNG